MIPFLIEERYQIVVLQNAMLRFYGVTKHPEAKFVCA